jgi:hypothetical protein
VNEPPSGGDWEPAAEILSPRSLRAKDLYAISVSLVSDEIVKDPENDLSQLNRLGVAYFHVCLLPISTTDHIGFSSAQQLSVLLLSHSVSNDIQTTLLIPVQV